MGKPSRAWFEDSLARQKRRRERERGRLKALGLWLESVRIPYVLTGHKSPHPYGVMRECYWCGQRIHYGYANDGPNKATRDHLHPIALGGPNIPENIVAACKACNSRRGCDMTWKPFAER